MKTLVLALMLVVTVSPALAGDWSFNYLKKLYHKDPETCYKRCETIMNLFPGQESAWFFALKLEVNQVAFTPKVKVKSARMNRAVDYARYFDKNASAELKQLTGWDSVQPWLTAIAVDVMAELDEANLNLNVKQLDERWKKYTGTPLKASTSEKEQRNEVTTTTLTTTSLKTTVTTSNAKAPSANTSKDFSLTGMPKGTENIASGNAKAEKELLVLINKERKRLKMDTLIWNPDLARACRYHAMDMGTQQYFDHNSYDQVNGKLVEVGGTFDRIRKFYSTTFVNSENIAAGNSSAEGTYQQWFNSPGHYANMFNRSSKYVGIGTVSVSGGYGSYWVFCTAQ